VEFELTSTPAEVAKLRKALEPAVLAALAGDHESPRSLDDDLTVVAAVKTETVKRPARRPRVLHDLRGGEGEQRARVWQNLLAAAPDGFPSIGARPDALYAAYMLLRWARETLDIEGLTAHEIQAFLTMKLHLPYASEAYAAAIASRAHNGEVEVIGDQPKVYRLTESGERLLRKRLGMTNGKGAVG
jgi:hypothetical protein